MKDEEVLHRRTSLGTKRFLLQDKFLHDKFLLTGEVVHLPTLTLARYSISLLTCFCLTSVTFSTSDESASLLSLVDDKVGVSTRLVGVASVVVGASNNSSVLLSLLPVEPESVFGIEFTSTAAEVGGTTSSFLLLLIEGTPPLG